MILAEEQVCVRERSLITSLQKSLLGTPLPPCPQPDPRGADLGDAVLGLQDDASQEGHCVELPRWPCGPHERFPQGVRLVGLPQPRRLGGGRLHLRQPALKPVLRRHGDDQRGARRQYLFDRYSG